MATVLYTALADLELTSAFASWPWPAGRVAPLSDSAQSTVNLLAQGLIEVAAPGSTDNTTPPYVVRGQPGLRAPGTVSN